MRKNWRHSGPLDDCGPRSSSKHLELNCVINDHAGKCWAPAKALTRLLSGFRMSVSRQGVVVLAPIEDANGDLTGRKALYLDSTTTAGLGNGRGTGFGSATRDLRVGGAIQFVSAPLAARRCAIVRRASRCIAGNRSILLAGALVKRTTVFLPSAIQLPCTGDKRACRSVGRREFVSRRPTIAERSLPDPIGFDTQARAEPRIPPSVRNSANVNGKRSLGQLWVAGRPKVRQNFAHDLGMST
jgi:hypothetical protein